MDQSDSKVTLMYPKSCENDPKVSKSDPRMTPKCPKVARAAQSFAALASSGPSWTTKKSWRNVYLLLMGPFGSDTRRFDMHYKCHSTSICRFWRPFFTFRPLSSTKVTPVRKPRCSQASKPRSLEVPRRESRSEIN